ncbi:hypothetical protein CDD83_9814 [Cordyceps sp. RAO-2017]|nr:hypothetical protein CDD83_9814 [Cordyceps sp. RAO-2017]
MLDDKAAGRPRALLDALDAWAAERSLDLVVVNSASSDPDSPDGRFRRELLVWGRGPRAVAAVARFVDLAARPLRLESWRGGCLDDGADRFAWHQHELSASRKKIAPLLRQAMREAPPAEKHAL